jgi:hypothetical protein
MNNQTVLEFALGNPNNLNNESFQSFLEEQNIISVKTFFIVDNGIKIDLHFAIQQSYLSKFQNAYIEFNKNYIKNLPKSIKIEPVERTVLEFSMGNPKQLNNNQVWNFIENQEIITIEDIIVSDSGIKVNLHFEAIESDVYKFLNSFKLFSENPPNNIEEINHIQLENPFSEEHIDELV